MTSPGSLNAFSLCSIHHMSTSALSQYSWPTSRGSASHSILASAQWAPSPIYQIRFPKQFSRPYVIFAALYYCHGDVHRWPASDECGRDEQPDLWQRARNTADLNLPQISRGGREKILLKPGDQYPRLALAAPPVPSPALWLITGEERALLRKKKRKEKCNIVKKKKKIGLAQSHTHHFDNGVHTAHTTRECYALF